MMSKLRNIVPLIFFLSCGIPSADYIGGANVISSSDSSLSFEIDMGTWSKTTSFSLYARYFILESDNTEDSFPDDLDNSEMNNNTITYIQNLGYKNISFILSTEVDTSIYEFPVQETETFTIKYDSSNSLQVYMSRINNNIYSLYYNDASNTDISHSIGIYSDTNGKEFIKTLEGDNDSISSIYIEFVIISYGRSDLFERIESLPVYIEPLQVQTF